MGVIFNGVDRLIEVTDPLIFDLDAEDDIYSRWKDWVQLGDNGKYAPALRTFGGDGTKVGQTAPKYFFLQNYWRVFINNGNVVSVGLNLYTDDYATPYIVGPGSGISDSNSDAAVVDTGGGTGAITQEDIDNISAGVWDEELKGTTHNIPTSAGRRLRELIGPITTGEVISATINTVTLNGDAAANTGAYDPGTITILSGTGYGQSRLILEYDGPTKTAVLDRNWKTIPDATSEYAIYPSIGREHVNEGASQGGTINTITLNTYASAQDDAYINQIVFIRSGVGEDQVGVVIGYNGTTKVATVEKDWSTIPDSTSGYVMLPVHVHDLNEMNSWSVTQRNDVIAWARKASDNAEQANTKLN